MTKDCTAWSNVRSIRVIDDKSEKILNLEYDGFNKLYCRELNQDYWFNNALFAYVYVGLCIYLYQRKSLILERYEVVEVLEYV